MRRDHQHLFLQVGAWHQAEHILRGECAVLLLQTIGYLGLHFLSGQAAFFVETLYHLLIFFAGKSKHLGGKRVGHIEDGHL